MNKPAKPASAAKSAAEPLAEPTASADIAPLIEAPDADPVPAYDPAEYRWVPVRRRPRYDGWTAEKQRRFIEVLADTGMVAHAARAVGLTREGAYRLRRSAHGGTFARAWDAAREHAGSLIEDIAFERAIEGVEHNVYDENGEVVCTRRSYNDRLLTYLLGHLKPERYGRAASVATGARKMSPHLALAQSLHAMEPQLPAPAEQLLGSEVLADELDIADAADGVLPRFLSEMPAEKSPARMQVEAVAAQQARGLAVAERLENRKAGEAEPVTRSDLVDLTRALDPASRKERTKKRFR